MANMAGVGGVAVLLCTAAPGDFRRDAVGSEARRTWHTRSRNISSHLHCHTDSLTFIGIPLFGYSVIRFFGSVA